MATISKDLRPEPLLGPKRPPAWTPPALGGEAAPTPAPVAVPAPTEFERKFVVPASVLPRVRAIRGVERRMVYDTYIEPAVRGLPRLRFRFETSIDPLLGNSEDGTVVIAAADFTVKTGDNAARRTETIYPLAFHSPSPLAAINAFSSIYGARVQSERFRWSGTDGQFHLAIYGGDNMIVEIETSSEANLLRYTPPPSWREVTHDPRYSNYSIAACGWPE